MKFSPLQKTKMSAFLDSVPLRTTHFETIITCKTAMADFEGMKDVLFDFEGVSKLASVSFFSMLVYSQRN